MSDDEWLREAGFAIVSRPIHGEATWRHFTGLSLRESEAIALLSSQSIEALRLQQLARERRAAAFWGRS